jgi:hypothetical protein
VLVALFQNPHCCLGGQHEQRYCRDRWSRPVQPRAPSGARGQGEPAVAGHHRPVVLLPGWGGVPPGGPEGPGGPQGLPDQEGLGEPPQEQRPRGSAGWRSRDRAVPVPEEQGRLTSGQQKVPTWFVGLRKSPHKKGRVTCVVVSHGAAEPSGIRSHSLGIGERLALFSPLQFPLFCKKGGDEEFIFAHAIYCYSKMRIYRVGEGNCEVTDTCLESRDAPL